MGSQYSLIPQWVLYHLYRKWRLQHNNQSRHHRHRDHRHRQHNLVQLLSITPSRRWLLDLYSRGETLSCSVNPHWNRGSFRLLGLATLCVVLIGAPGGASAWGSWLHLHLWTGIHLARLPGTISGIPDNIQWDKDNNITGRSNESTGSSWLLLPCLWFASNGRLESSCHQARNCHHQGGLACAPPLLESGEGRQGALCIFSCDQHPQVSVLEWTFLYHTTLSTR